MAKIRSGFISNSSSFSFCLMGVGGSAEEWRDTLMTKRDDAVLMTDNDITSVVEDLVFYDKRLSLEYGISDYAGWLFVGKEARNWDKDKTVNQLKDEMEEILVDLFGSSLPRAVDIYVDGGYNG